MSSQHEWLNLIEISGPFLALPVLKKVFPNGLDGLESGKARRMRSAYGEWRESVDSEDADLSVIHQAWINEVLSTALEIEETELRRSDKIPEQMSVINENGIAITPDMVVVNPTKIDKPLLPIFVYDPATDVSNSLNSSKSSTSPTERMLNLLKLTECPLGLITNGEKWMLVHAKPDVVSGFATWYARIWAQEPETLQAFASLLNYRRFMRPEQDRLENLYTRSLDYQDDVTKALGDQVSRAVEILVHALDRVDQDRNRQLLKDIDSRELYEATLTILMRLVFLLAAEERGMLLLGDPNYDENYAISTLRMQLREQLEFSEEVLENRYSAWTRLNALFRIVYGGIEHSTLRQPALGGSLFDPDRFPFLEGRANNSNWKSDLANPLPIDDLTVLYILDEIQTYHGRTLSYRSLDVEQIGHVYEGLLEKTVARIEEPALELKCSSKLKSARITINELSDTVIQGFENVVAKLAERSARSISSIQKDLNSEVDNRLTQRILASCQNDENLWNLIKPYSNIIKCDSRGFPLIHLANSFVVKTGDERRETGTHYTPKELTEKIVEETLNPLIYDGPEEGKPKSEWRLKSEKEILDLKICDPAMGSGAFLVQTCRWLSDRLVEAWSNFEQTGGKIDIDGRTSNDALFNEEDPLPMNVEDRTVIARRIIAEKCLYGIDKNPLAVELTKLSLWLTTIAKGYPFGFLDHNLRSGDSLFGIQDIDQLGSLDLKVGKWEQRRLIGKHIEESVKNALKKRMKLREIPIHNIENINQMTMLHSESKDELSFPTRIADALVGITLADFQENSADRYSLSDRISFLAKSAVRYEEGDSEAKNKIIRESQSDLSIDSKHGEIRCPFHWPLEFPEVFHESRGGFDAIVGNPPFLGGKRVSGAIGILLRDWIVEYIANGMRRSADLVVFFFLRTFDLIREGGGLGLLASNSIAEGGNREVGLEVILRKGGTIYCAYTDEIWAGAASVITSRVHIRKGNWRGKMLLSNRPVSIISSFLDGQNNRSLTKLIENQDLSFIGSALNGAGLLLEKFEAERMLDDDPKNADVILPILNGNDLNSDPEQHPSRFAINFWDWPEDKAKEYNLPYSYLTEYLYPERLEQSKMPSYKGIMSIWWQHWRPRSPLYHKIGRGRYFIEHQKTWNLDLEGDRKTLVVARTSNSLAFCFVPNNWIYTDALAVIASDKISTFAVLNSSIHAIFAWKYSSKFGSQMRYSPSDALEKFPMPNIEDAELESIGDQFDKLRKKYLIENSIGLTDFFNQLNDESQNSSSLAEIRDLKYQLDKNVLRVYGWEDVNLDIGFHDVSYLKGARHYTISENARLEILERLAKLNQVRYETEVKLGYHKKVAKSSKPVNKLKSDPRISPEFEYFKNNL